MANDPEWMVTLGLKVQDLTAGVAGGVVNAFVFKRADPWAVAGSIVVGALTANYLGEYGVRYVGMGQGAAAFIIGLCGMAICQGIMSFVKQRVSSLKLPADGGHDGFAGKN